MCIGLVPVHPWFILIIMLCMLYIVQYKSLISSYIKVIFTVPMYLCAGILQYIYALYTSNVHENYVILCVLNCIG